MTFIPPAYEPPKAMPWATYIPNRQPNFKVHSSKAKAMSAVRYRYHQRYRGGNVYQLVDMRWMLYEVIEPGSGPK